MITLNEEAKQSDVWEFKQFAMPYVNPITESNDLVWCHFENVKQLKEGEHFVIINRVEIKDGQVLIT